MQIKNYVRPNGDFLSLFKSIFAMGGIKYKFTIKKHCITRCLNKIRHLLALQTKQFHFSLGDKKCILRMATIWNFCNMSESFFLSGMYSSGLI